MLLEGCRTLLAIVVLKMRSFLKWGWFFLAVFAQILLTAVVMCQQFSEQKEKEFGCQASFIAPLDEWTAGDKMTSSHC